MERNGFESAVISSLEIYNRRCITKKRFNIEHRVFYEEKVTKNGEKNDYSVGKSLDVLLKKLRNGEMLGLTSTNDGYFIYYDDIFSEKDLKLEYEDFLDFFF